MEELDPEEFIKRIKALNTIKDGYEFATCSQARITPDLLLWNFLRDEQYSRESDTFLKIMDAEGSWEKLRNSKILKRNQIETFKSASELLQLMSAKNFTISHFLKICIEDNLLPYPSDTVSFLHDLNYGYQLLKIVRDIDCSADKVKRKVNGILEEFNVVYARVGPDPVTIQVQASGIPSPRYEWFYRPHDDPSSPNYTEEFTWVPLAATQDNVLYFDPFTFSDSGYYYCKIQHNLCVVAEVTRAKLDDWMTSRKIFLRPERGSLVITKQPVPAECSFGGSIAFECEGESFELLSYQWFKDDEKLVGEDKQTLRLSNLTLENTGNYHCVVSTAVFKEKSYVVRLSVNTSSPVSCRDYSECLEDGSPNGVGEHMVVKSQPQLPKYARQPMPIGEKINLKFEVSCGLPVTYEWLKQGIREDVTSNSEVTVKHPVCPVSNGRELVGEVVEGGEGITCWQYVCRAFCPSTGESLFSDMINIKVAKATTNECSFPKFKVALVICEEKYQKFPSLRATRNDGDALIRALQELHFQVLAFTNLTLVQLKNAIDLFSSFIDDETYALFYYNGHAVGHMEDIYLATVESSLDEHDPTPLSQILLHHGYVEAVISEKNPLLGVLIYDSCRDDPKDFVKKKLEASKQSSGYIIKSSPNLILAYGTMPNMKAFEESDLRTGTQVGVYMKHLLNHIGKKDLDIERVFKNVQNDFQKLTAASISEKMKPEYRSSLGQEMYLGASLRQKKTNVLQKAFFRLTRYEYIFSPFSMSSGNGRFEFPQGIKCEGGLSWVHGQVSQENGFDAVLTLVATPSAFFNECDLHFQFEWRSPAGLPPDVNVQVVGRNVSLVTRSMYVDKVSGEQHALETVYQPCTKDRKDTFLTKDGPMFKFKEGQSRYPESGLVLTGLQELKDRVKLLLILRTADQVTVAPGLVCFPLPIMDHTENLIIRDKKQLYAGIVQSL